MTYLRKLERNGKVLDMELIKTKRSSNFEALRVLAMFLIILHHITVHCIINQLTDQDTIINANHYLFSTPEIFRRIWILDFGAFFGPVGNSIFILISGYFMVQKANINLVAISGKLLPALAFSAIALMMISFALYNFIGGSSYVGGTEISVFNNESWFIGYYFVVILCGKLFLNKFLSRIKRAQYLELLCGLFVIIELSWSGSLLDGVGAGIRLLFTGLFLYSLGGYINQYDPFKNIRTVAFVLLLFFIAFVLCISFYNFQALDIETYIKSVSEELFINRLYSFSNYNIMVIITGVALFELFRRMEMPHSSVMNFLGVSTFMVYLMHDNPLIYSIWDQTNWIILLGDHLFLFLIKYVLYALATFLFGIISYVVYLGVMKLLGVCLKKLSYT